MEEQELIKCPICNESFRDKRGLTSHAKNIHDLEKDEIFEKMTQKDQEKKEWKVIGGLATAIIALLMSEKS